MDRNHSLEYVKSVVGVLKQIRLKQSVSHEKLASLTGLNRSSISRIESGENIPTLLTLFLMCDALKVDLQDVLKQSKK